MATILADLEALPHTRPINMGDISCTDFAINCREYRDNTSEVKPEVEALNFYALNHLIAVIKASYTKHERLPSWAEKAVNLYTEALIFQGQRLLNYMVLITTRESRHVHKQTSLLQEVATQFGNECKTFNESIHGAGSGGAVSQFLSTAPAVSLGSYLGSLRYMFFEGKFSGGYGGKPWGYIAQTLEHFLIGKTSLEVMIDTAYTLAHNNGPMFNKGMLYSHYSNEIYKILDVQRSGQIPELIMSKSLSTKCDGAIPELITECLNDFPNAFGEYVDWHKVEALGSLHKYHSEKAAQDAKHPKVSKTAGGFLITGKFAVMPGKVAHIYDRKSAA